MLKDITHEDLESLLSFMYVGEVNVVQDRLASLIKTAECLRIKGLAIPDEQNRSRVVSSPSGSREKRTHSNNSEKNFVPKRFKQESGSSGEKIMTAERDQNSSNNLTNLSLNSNEWKLNCMGKNEHNDCSIKGSFKINDEISIDLVDDKPSDLFDAIGSVDVVRQDKIILC